MRIPLRPAVAVFGAGVVVLVTVIAWGVTRMAVAEALYSEGQNHLAAATGLGAERMSSSRDLPLDSVAGLLALSTGYRVSVFDADLALIADSDLEGVPVDAAAEQDRRTEVLGALRRVRASSRRTSALDGRPYLFSAARLYWQGAPVVIRFGAPAEAIGETAAGGARQVALAVLTAGLAALLFVQRKVGRLAVSLAEVRRLLARLGAGQPPGPRIRLPRVTELARLTSSANRVRGELEEQVGRVSRERDELAQLMDEVGEGLMALTDDARILRINPAARELLGLFEVLPFAPVGSIIRDPVLRDLLEASVIRPEGRLEVTVGNRELEVRTKRGTEGGSVVLLVDITELRRLEAVRSDFVANASHELKTPLTVIRAAAETLLDEDLPAGLHGQWLHSIEANTVRLQRLVDDLLDLSRYESGAWRPQREPFSADLVAWSAWQEVESGAERGGVDFEVVGQGEGLGDEAAVYQIFRNLFENALRYVREENGRIMVVVGAEEDRLVVAVKDNGTGIPASALPRIFERFYRVDAARSRKEGGTGLGLAIVRHLVSSMGGEVWAESTLGAGASITFAVPLHLATDLSGDAE